MITAVLIALAWPAFAQAAPKLPDEAVALPLIRQTTSYDCGPAALLSALKYWQVYPDGAGDDTALFPLLDTTPKDGTDPAHLAFGAKHFGLSAQLHENMTPGELRDDLAAGETVILDLQAWRDEKTKDIAWKDDWEDGHYVVLAGMDSENAYVMDPSTKGAYAWLPLDELLERWHDYEDRDGTIRRNLRLGLVMRGARAASRSGGPAAGLERME